MCCSRRKGVSKKFISELISPTRSECDRKGQKSCMVVTIYVPLVGANETSLSGTD